MKDLRSLPNIIACIESDRRYFENCAKDGPLFRPELELAEKILALIRGGAVDRNTRQQVRAALDAPIAEHYGGSGWCDLVRQIERWLEVAAEQDGAQVKP
jgi:hypothetical protein